MGATWEAVGLILRSMGAKDPQSSTFPQVSNLLVLLAPLWINAFVYMVGGRMIYHWLPEKKVWKVRARLLSRWFVWIDVATFLVQAAGGTMLDSDDADTANNGLHLCTRP